VPPPPPPPPAEQAVLETVKVRDAAIVIVEYDGSQSLVPDNEVVILYREGDCTVMLSPEVMVKMTVVVPTSTEVAVEPATTVRVSGTPERYKYEVSGKVTAAAQAPVAMAKLMPNPKTTAVSNRFLNVIFMGMMVSY
jgi:hypothetical protein